MHLARKNEKGLRSLSANHGVREREKIKTAVQINWEEFHLGLGWWARQQMFAVQSSALLPQAPQPSFFLPRFQYRRKEGTRWCIC